MNKDEYNILKQGFMQVFVLILFLLLWVSMSFVSIFTLGLLLDSTIISAWIIGALTVMYSGVGLFLGILMMRDEKEQ